MSAFARITYLFGPMLAPAEYYRHVRDTFHANGNPDIAQFSLSAVWTNPGGSEST